MRFLLTLFILVAGSQGWGSSIGGIGGPPILNHQGVVKVNGEPFNGTGEFRFALIDSETGDELWTNDGSSSTSLGFPNLGVPILVTNGLYSVILGDDSLPNMIPISGDVFQSNNVVLRIWFSDGSNGVERLFPDHVLTSAPYSFRSLSAVDADTLGGLDSSDLISQAAGNVRMFNEEFVVTPGETVEAGNVVSFVDGSALVRSGFAPAGAGPEMVFAETNTFDGVGVAAMDENRIVVAYSKNQVLDEAQVRVGEISGDLISFGSPETLTPASALQISITPLTDSRFAIAYSDGNNSGWGTVKIGVISGNSISFGNGVAFNTSITSDIDVVALTEDRIVIGYNDFETSDTCTARVGSVSGTLISLGPEVPVSPDNTDFLTTARLSPTRVVFCYEDESANRGRAAVGEIEAGNLTVGPLTTMSLDRLTRFGCSQLSTNRFVVAFVQVLDSGQVSAAMIGTASGQSIYFSQIFRYRDSSTNGPIQAVGLAPDRFALATVRTGAVPNPNIGDWVFGAIDQNRIEYPTEGFFNLGSTENTKIASLTPERFVIAYTDGSNSSFGTLRIVRPIPAPIIGIAREGGTAGETVSVTLFTKGSVSDSHTGLRPGMTYHGQPDGRVTPDGSGIRLGVAVSPTEILLAPQ